MKLAKFASIVLLTCTFSGCSDKTPSSNIQPQQLLPEYQNRLDIYQTITLKADLSHFSDKQKKMLSLLIEAAEIMDELFWQQAFKQNKKQFLANINDEKVRKFAEINYGPWDRMAGDQAFLTHTESKAHGAEFYPSDINKTEVEQGNFTDKKGLYSLVRRNDEGQLFTLAYSEAYADEINRAAAILEKASTFAQDKEFANYLEYAAHKTLRSDDYQASDFAWMDIEKQPY